MSDITQKLPLFPLGSVLFPGATINLHIFGVNVENPLAKILYYAGIINLLPQ